MKAGTVESVGSRGFSVAGHERGSASEAFVAGMAFNVASLYVSNPYAISVLTLALAGFAVLRWHGQRLAWIALASTVAANPVNLSASVACNLLIATTFLLLSVRHIHRVPRWLYIATGLALLSVVGSIPFWSAGTTVEAMFAQGRAVFNYVLGPLFLMPVIYVGTGGLADATYLVKGLLGWLIVPSALLLVLARAFGSPVVDPSNVQAEYQLFAVYRLWNVDVTLMRTQAGIVLAALACASFALLIAASAGRCRWTAGVCVVVCCVLMLLTGSVGSGIALLLGIAVVLVVASRRVKSGQYVLIGAIGAAVVASGWRFLPVEVLEYVGARYDERFSVGSGIGASDRTEIWARAVEYAQQNPNGVGWSLYLDRLGIYPHNDYLSYAIAFGVLCGALYLYLAGRLWWKFATGLRQHKEEDRFALGAAGLGAATVLIVNSMSDHLTANRWYFNVVWSIIWYCYFASTQPASARQWEKLG
jgi:O-antigen ligase/polysaccharide polymerase Wzy-like membrane protein